MASLSFERWSMKSPISPAKDPRNRHLERRYHARRLEILRAAGREFRLRGFAETGKHDILFFCQDNSLDRMITTLDNARRMRTSAAIKLRIVIVSHLRCVLDEVEGSTAHLLTTALPRRQKHYLVAKRDKYEAGVRNLIVAGMRSGEFAPCDPALAVRIILGGLNWSVQWFSPEGPLTAAEIAERFADYLIRGLLAKPGAPQRLSFEKDPHRALRGSLPRNEKKRASVR